jgi:hypothetical protein
MGSPERDLNELVYVDELHLRNVGGRDSTRISQCFSNEDEFRRFALRQQACIAAGRGCVDGDDLFRGETPQLSKQVRSKGGVTPLLASLFSTGSDSESIKHIMPDPTWYRRDCFCRYVGLLAKDKTWTAAVRDSGAVVKNKRSVGRLDCLVEQRHRPEPPGHDTISGHIMPAVCHTYGDTLDVGSWIVDANEEDLNEKSRSPCADQNINLACVRHHGFEAEAAPCFDACFAALIRNTLRPRNPSLVRAHEIPRDIVRIDMFAEVDPALLQSPDQCGLSRTVRSSDH